jgi:hypothetical protein
MYESNWKSSGRSQEKPKKRPRKLEQWIAAHKLLVARLKAGINCNDDPANNSRVFCLLLAT